VRDLEYLLLLHANAGQIDDIEKATPIDFIGGGAPPRQTIMLTLQ